MQENSDRDNPLNSTILKLGLISFFTDVATDMLYPITPIFLTTVLGTSMASLGFIEGVAESITSLLKIYSGNWSDRIGKRKPFMMVGYFLSAISKPLIGLSVLWPQVMGARVLDRLGKGARTAPRDALIDDSVSESKRGAAYGWHRGIDTMGAVVGPLLALIFLTQQNVDMRDMFFWALIPGLIATGLVLLIKESPQKSTNIAAAKWPVLNLLVTWKLFDHNFKKYIWAWVFFSLANSSDVFLLMKVKSAGYSTEWVVGLYCLYNLVYALLSPSLGILSDRIGRKTIMTSGLVVFAFVYGGFGFANELWHFAVLFSIYGVYMAMTEGSGKAFVVDLVPAEYKATALGLLGTVVGITTIVASLMAGLLWDFVGSSWSFYYGSAGALMAFILLNRVNTRKS